MGNAEFQLIGKGIYSIAEASRFTNIPRRRIRRWIRGYEYRSGEARRTSPQVIERDFPDIGGISALSFLDLIEVRFINAFRDHGVSWLVIKRAAANAARLLHSSHPFATYKFKTDRKTILADILKADHERGLLDLDKLQYELRELLLPFLFLGIDFEGDLAVRWWPLENKKSIVIDPARSFGKPIVAKEGVPTNALADAYRVEKSIDCVASWFEVKRSSVEDALRFEKVLAA